MARVYLAVQESLERSVALKVLSEDFTGETEESRRFLEEGRIVASLNHRNIITIHDVGIANDRHYISMEYVEGGDLRACMEAGVPVEAALGLARDIGGCLDFAHRAGVVHRDVKPANILYRLDGTPVLTDFGIAKRLSADPTITRSVFGTPGYLSPEQVQAKPVDGRSDLYSLGVVLYEMLVRQRPFEADTEIATILKQLQDPVPDLPPELGRFQPLLDRMLAIDPDDRFADAPQMLHALQEVIAGEPGAASPAAARIPAGVRSDGALREHAEQGLAIDFQNARLVRLAIRLETRARVEPLLASADAAIDDLRLTTPPEDNALHYYEAALELDPDNVEATEGLARIAERYASLAEDRIASYRYAEAREYIRRGLEVQPQDRELLALRQRAQIKHAPKQIIRDIKGLFD